MLYLFLLSIETLGCGLKLVGQGVIEKLIQTTNNPFSGLFVGILVTSIVQSSSAVTSIVVGLVGCALLPLSHAIPIIMGANIGTTVTNTLVSFAFLSSRLRLPQIYACATVHDFFNLLSVTLFFPLELLFHPIERTSGLLAHIFKSIGGIHLTSPLKVILGPGAKLLISLLHPFPLLLLIFSLFLLFASLKFLADHTRRLISGPIEVFLDRYLFRSPLQAFLLGLFFTAFIQSSSVTTSLVIPLVAAGLLELKIIYPYTLGANLGTTVTAILASLVTGSLFALQSAFAHLLFNLLGILVWYPLRILPITLATKLGNWVSKNRVWAVIYLFGTFFLIPILLISLFRR